MRKTLLSFVLVFTALTISADELPKDCYGFYAGEMAPYSVVKNDVELNIDKHDVHIQITTTGILYKSGTIQLKGTYTFLKESGTQYLIKANLSNGKSVSYQVDLVWNKKLHSLFVPGKNGEPDLTMVKLD